MKISIITVCLNSEDTIFDCLNSISEQNFPNIESIIIDGGSTDKTLEIIKGFDQLNKVIISEPDLGIYDALNKGIDVASGDVIGILHSDDILASKQAISLISNAFIENDDTNCVHGDLVYVHRYELNKVYRYWKAGRSSKLQFLFGWMPPHPTFYLKKELFKIVGYYRMDLGTAADYEFLLRVLFKFGYKSKYIPEVLVKMRKGGVSNESIHSRLLANKQDKKAWEVNGLKHFFFTIPLKPVRKLPQYVLAKALNFIKKFRP